MENRKIIDYIIISDFSAVILPQKVKEKMEEGYVPLGGMVTGSSVGFFQTMVKYEE